MILNIYLSPHPMLTLNAGKRVIDPNCSTVLRCQMWKNLTITQLFLFSTSIVPRNKECK
jgi:hypothetical protein